MLQYGKNESIQVASSRHCLFEQIGKSQANGKNISDKKNKRKGRMKISVWIKSWGFF